MPSPSHGEQAAWIWAPEMPPAFHNFPEENCYEGASAYANAFDKRILFLELKRRLASVRILGARCQRKLALEFYIQLPDMISVCPTGMLHDQFSSGISALLNRPDAGTSRAA